MTSPTIPSVHVPIGTLFKAEKWWRDQYTYILKQGYKLPRRYHPDWEPSWGEDLKDGQPTPLLAMNATRQHDGTEVRLKKVEGSYELKIAQFLSHRTEDSRNHCVPLWGIIEIPNDQDQIRQILMVIPIFSPLDNPPVPCPVKTFRHFVAFFTQISENLQFMHEQNIAHRGAWMFTHRMGRDTVNNIMFDPSEMHPKKGPRYMIYFSLSRRYLSQEVIEEPLHVGDKSVPEHQHGTQCNPFYTDIYYLGNLVRREFIEKYSGFEFMQDLVNEMTHEDPDLRPRIGDVVNTFSQISEPQTLGEAKLSSPLESKNNHTARRALHHLHTGLQRILPHKAAVSEP